MRKPGIAFTLLIGLSALFLTPQLSAQNVAQQSVHLGGGSSHFATQGPFNGCGLLINAGWQKTLKNQSLRFSPDLTAGFYNNNCTDDAFRADYTSLTFRGIFNFDFIQSGNFAAFIGGGPVVNYSFGDLTGLRTMNPNDPRLDLIPSRETQFHPGMTFNIGLRFMPKKYRLGFELIPVNAQFDFSDYSELIFQARFFYKLDTRRNPVVEKR